MELTRDQVRALRMRALLLDEPASDAAVAGRTVAQVVEHFGAMQGQDLASVEWSLGVRIPGSTQADIHAALERREAVRTWPLRGTIHLVPTRDAAWTVRLLGERQLAGVAKRREYLGLTEDDAERAVAIWHEALSGGGRLTRSACVALLGEHGIDTAGQRGYHLLWYASQKGVTAIGPNEGKEQTFVLLDEWAAGAGEVRELEGDEAWGQLALMYFRGRGPAPVKEITRWAGIGVREARHGVAAAGDALVQVDTEDGPMVAWAPALDGAGTMPGPGSGGQRWWALPGFDEYMLGYGERSWSLDPGHFDAVVPGKNGVFRATVVRDGRVMAVWTRTVKAKTCDVVVTDLQGLSKADRAEAERAFGAYEAFVGKPLRFTWN